MAEQPRTHRRRAVIARAVTQWSFMLFVLLATGWVFRHVLPQGGPALRQYQGLFGVSVAIAFCVSCLVDGLGLGVKWRKACGGRCNVYFRIWRLFWGIMSALLVLWMGGRETGRW